MSQNEEIANLVLRDLQTELSFVDFEYFDWSVKMERNPEDRARGLEQQWGEVFQFQFEANLSKKREEQARTSGKLGTLYRALKKVYDMEAIYNKFTCEFSDDNVVCSFEHVMDLRLIMRTNLDQEISRKLSKAIFEEFKEHAGPRAGVDYIMSDPDLKGTQAGYEQYMNAPSEKISPEEAKDDVEKWLRGEPEQEDSGEYGLGGDYWKEGINKIARLITDDPDIFNDNGEA